MAATFMIGDGLLGVLQPQRHVELWEKDAMGAERMVAPFRGRPGRRRLYGFIQIAAGLALAARQRKHDQPATERPTRSRSTST
ncbi:hypothetical protein [Sphingomonas sp. IW22]|uniref:hypothetical protein n=1 Tax=Sphingomonas sp. IW22 TaxID=3242489 RepID=UPI0035210BEC